MSKQVEIGQVQGSNEKRGRQRYDVRLPDGTLVVVNERLIAPRPRQPLARGTELAVEHKDHNVTAARLHPAPAPVSDRPTLAPEVRPARRSSSAPGAESTLGLVADSGIAESIPLWPESTPPRGTTAPRRETPAETAIDAPIACPEVEPIFAPGGPVSRLLGDRYRPRAGQIQMASLVRDALQSGQHAFVEAGTGIGKSFAYLIPVIWSGTPAIVSTSNKALMEQLWTQDLPQLQRIAPRPVTTALLKGRSNYLCALRWEAMRQDPAQPSAAARIRFVEEKLAEVPSGDCELMRLPGELWRKLAADRDGCQGRKCPAFRSCFYERAKDAARAADLVVTNHALLCLNVLAGDNRILPVRPVLIVDEAHELQRYAIHMLTRELVHGGLPAVVNHEITRGLIDEDEQQEARETNQAFFEAIYRLRPHPRKQAPPQAWALEGEIQEGIALYEILHKICDKLANYAPSSGEEGPLTSLRWLAQEVKSAAYYLGHREAEDAVRVCSLRPGQPDRAENCQAHYAPLDVSDLLHSSLFQAWPRVICTSATLSVGSNLSWFKQRVGASNSLACQDAVIGSPFDYRRNALIYVPSELMPEYGQGEGRYEERLFEIIRELVRHSRGRAFLLFTSYRRMNRAYQRLAPEWDYPCFCQGQDLARTAMLGQFRAEGNAVLFGTRSFWQGVDVPGDALSLVVLDKIPFRPANDPVVAKETRLYDSQNGKGFETVQLGPAILTLRQGLGRLIRSETDRGVMAILDSRAIDHSHYGIKIWQSLPPARHTRDLEDVRQFFERSEG